MFINARPIWIKDKECEMNVHAVFRVQVDIRTKSKLHIAGTAFYRVFVNGTFIGAGPARTAKGYVREDILPLDVQDGMCEILIETVGYYCCSYSTVLQPSCILAEIQCDGASVAYSGRDFEAYYPKCKVQKAERYSMQRHFCEVWDYKDFTSLTDERNKVQTMVLPDMPCVIDRQVPYPLYEDIDLNKVYNRGIYTYDETLPYKKESYSWAELPEEWGRFEWDEIMHHPYMWLQRQKQTIIDRNVTLPLILKKGEFAIVDFGRIEAGFIKALFETTQESDVVIGFNEYYQSEEFNLPRAHVHNVVEIILSEGDCRDFQSFEPYTFRFVIIAVKEGEVRLNSVGVKTYMFDISNIENFECENQNVNEIYRAAVRTFAHNAVDLYTDCPSRERAGWLCDSYFTAKTEYVLTGNTKVEDAFLENYCLFENDGSYIEGVIPPCYPTDPSDDGVFIPQWTMWYIIEVEEYINKRGHQDMVEKFRKSIYDLLGFYRRYENDDGLLEGLPSWNFVEWSNANEWTQDVNYPTNFLYSKVLECIYLLYGDEECLRRSEEVRKATVAQSFNGCYFMDHAVRDENGILRLQEHSSEAGQYYAVLFGGIDINSEKYAELKRMILHVFTPDRKDVMPEILEVNAFIGAYLRLEVLLKMKEYKLLLSDIQKFFGNMADYTGTLWEYRQFEGSLDHGFASYALVAIKVAMENDVKL